MRKIGFFSIMVLLIFTLSACGTSDRQSSSRASWAYPFVKWNGKTYKITKTQVDASKIGREIGTVTKYSDQEQSVSAYKNFSNIFKKGTKYYHINGTSSNKAIAVEKSKGVFTKAVPADD